MFDPFESNSLVRRKELGNQKVLLCIFLPLVIFCIVSGVALYLAMQATERSYIHPECACRKIMEQNRQQQSTPVFALA